MKNFTLRVVAVAAILAIVSGVGLAQGTQLRWGYRLTPLNVIFVNQGYAAKWGLKVKTNLFKTGTESRDALLAGAIDAGELGVTPTLTALARDPKDIVVIGVSQFGGGTYRVVVPVNSPAHSMKDLLHKKIAIRVGSGNYTAFLMWAKQQGYDINTDFKIVNMGDTDAMAALQSGSVDAVAYWEPIPAILVSKGIAREIFNFSGYVYNPVYLVARRDWIKKNPGAAAKLMAAWMQAQDFVRFHTKEAATISSEVLSKRGIDVSAAAYNLALRHETFEPWMYPDLLKETQSTYKFLQKQGAIPATDSIDWAKDFNPTYEAKAWDMLVSKAVSGN